VKAILRHDLFKQESAVLTITTCADLLNHMPAIYGFIKSNGLEAKLTSDMHSARITLSGKRLMGSIGNIQSFIEERGWHNNSDC
tara:strand:- start:2572 stop:2823 length:252 start_codon:yes stop_codon:yes gene_type:complete